MRSSEVACGSWCALGLFGSSGLLLGCSWTAPGSSWAPLGRSWAALGCSMGRSWPLLDHSWQLLDRSWPLLGRSWPLLGRSWRLKRPNKQNQISHHPRLWRHARPVLPSHPSPKFRRPCKGTIRCKPLLLPASSKPLSAIGHHPMVWSMSGPFSDAWASLSKSKHSPTHSMGHLCMLQFGTSGIPKLIQRMI